PPLLDAAARAALVRHASLRAPRPAPLDRARARRHGPPSAGRAAADRARPPPLALHGAAPPPAARAAGPDPERDRGRLHAERAARARRQLARGGHRGVLRRAVRLDLDRLLDRDARLRAPPAAPRPLRGDAARARAARSRRDRPGGAYRDRDADLRGAGAARVRGAARDPSLAREDGAARPLRLLRALRHAQPRARRGGGGGVVPVLPRRGRLRAHLLPAPP